LLAKRSKLFTKLFIITYYYTQSNYIPVFREQSANSLAAGLSRQPRCLQPGIIHGVQLAKRNMERQGHLATPIAKE
jgi:hypothetical protein